MSFFKRLKAKLTGDAVEEKEVNDAPLQDAAQDDADDKDERIEQTVEEAAPTVIETEEVKKQDEVAVVEERALDIIEPQQDEEKEEKEEKEAE